MRSKVIKNNKQIKESIKHSQYLLYHWIKTTINNLVSLLVAFRGVVGSASEIVHRVCDTEKSS